MFAPNLAREQFLQVLSEGEKLFVAVCKEEERISSMNSMKAFDIFEYQSIIMNRIGPHRDGGILIFSI